MWGIDWYQNELPWPLFRRPQTHFWHILSLENASEGNNFNDFTLFLPTLYYCYCMVVSEFFVAVVLIFFWVGGIRIFFWGVNYPSPPEMPRINTAYRSFKVTLFQPLPHIHPWISRKPLEMEAWFQMIINRKWPMTNRMVTWPITSRYPPERSNAWSKYAQSPVSRKQLEI